MKDEKLIQNKTAPVVSALVNNRYVKGILCFASYAIGTFDEYSDIDLYVFCEPAIALPSDRQKVLENIKGVENLQINYISFDRDNQWCPEGDRLSLNGVQVDIVYNTTDWIRTVVRSVTEESATSIPELKFRPYTMLGLLENSVILYDPESILRSLISKLYPYPTRLKEILISKNMSILRDSIIDLRDYVKRGIGNTAFLFLFQRTTDALATVLFAINEKYPPATKRVEESYEKLSILPCNFIERYTKLLEGPFNANGRKKVVSEVEAFIKEIEDLIDCNA